MKSHCLVHQDLVDAMVNEPKWVQRRFVEALLTFQRRFPRVAAFMHGDRRVSYSLWRRKLYGIVLTYTQVYSTLNKRLEYMVVAIDYATTRHAYATDDPRVNVSGTKSDVPATDEEIREEL
jgi:hypothetical protein